MWSIHSGSGVGPQGPQGPAGPQGPPGSGATSKWAGKVWNAIGDSLTEVEGTNTVKKYHAFIAEKIGCTVNNYGMGGTGWFTDRQAYDGWVAFHKRLNAVNANADLITVFGGTNDFGQTGGYAVPLGTFGDTDPATTFYGAVDFTIKKLVEKFPTKTIAIITPVPRSNGKTANSTGHTLEQYVDAIIKVAASYSVPTLDLFRHSGLYVWDASFGAYAMTDGVHPNATGHGLLADKILAFLNGL